LYLLSTRSTQCTRVWQSPTPHDDNLLEGGRPVLAGVALSSAVAVNTDSGMAKLAYIQINMQLDETNISNDTIMDAKYIFSYHNTIEKTCIYELNY
jgi:hypothetical protein